MFYIYFFIGLVISNFLIQYFTKEKNYSKALIISFMTVIVFYIIKTTLL